MLQGAKQAAQQLLQYAPLQALVNTITGASLLVVDLSQDAPAPAVFVGVQNAKATRQSMGGSLEMILVVPLFDQAIDRMTEILDQVVLALFSARALQTTFTAVNIGRLSLDDEKNGIWTAVITADFESR